MKRDHNNNSKSSVIPLVDAIRENYRRNSEDSTNTPSSRNKFYVSHTSPIDRQQTFRQHINPSSLAQNFFLNFTIPYNRRMSENYLTRTRPHMLLLLLLLADAFLGKEEIKCSGRTAVKKTLRLFQSRLWGGLKQTCLRPAKDDARASVRAHQLEFGHSLLWRHPIDFLRDDVAVLCVKLADWLAAIGSGREFPDDFAQVFFGHLCW